MNSSLPETCQGSPLCELALSYYDAATAIVHGLVLATRNTADISRTGVRYFNPFEDG